MKVLVTGVKGQLGYEVAKRLEEQNKDNKQLMVFGVDKEELDITDTIAVREYFQRINPDVVVHCAAYTAVDKAEQDQQNCFSVNVEGTENIAKMCKKRNAKMIYISTDYVFPGVGEAEYDINDLPNPVNYYGVTKVKGEEIVKTYVDKYFIVRTSWAFGESGDNFVNAMLRLAESRNSISVVADQVGSPTYTVDLAKLLCEMIETNKYGVYHANNEGFCSWYDFACEIFKQANISVDVRPITSEQYPTSAKRPKNSKLSKKSLDIMGFNRLPTWQEALNRYLIGKNAIK